MGLTCAGRLFFVVGCWDAAEQVNPASPFDPALVYDKFGEVLIRWLIRWIGKFSEGCGGGGGPRFFCDVLSVGRLRGVCPEHFFLLLSLYLTHAEA